MGLTGICRLASDAAGETAGEDRARGDGAPTSDGGAGGPRGGARGVKSRGILNSVALGVDGLL